ncbi:MAG: transposase [Deltaproteobacteria bacterium]|nr:transposase [Deltaproteobacteria bacterium]
MARARRLDAPGAVHHVILRGIERRRIFRSDEDRLDFLSRLDRLLPEEGWRCFVWVLMPNHVHLVIQSAQVGLSRLMARLNTGYARGFNLRHRRSGYVFQNRFKSRIVCDDADLIGLVAYVLRNPLEARLVSSSRELEEYPWCGLGALMGLRPARQFEAPSACLSLFGSDLQSARDRLRHWISRSESTACEDPAASLLPQESPDDDALVARVSEAPRPCGIRITAPSTSDHADLLGRLVHEVSLGLGALPEVVRSPGARGLSAEARSIIAWIAVDQLGLRRREVGDGLGISPTAVSHAARRGRSSLHRRRLRVEILRQPRGESNGLTG